MTQDRSSFFNLPHILGQQLFRDQHVLNLMNNVSGEGTHPISASMAGNTMLAPHRPDAVAVLKSALTMGASAFRDMNIAASPHSSDEFLNMVQIATVTQVLTKAEGELETTADPSAKQAIKARAEARIFDRDRPAQVLWRSIELTGHKPPNPNPSTIPP